MKSSIYVLIRDYDYEGFSPPLAAWNSFPTAEQILDYFISKFVLTEQKYYETAKQNSHFNSLYLNYEDYRTQVIDEYLEIANSIHKNKSCDYVFEEIELRS